MRQIQKGKRDKINIDNIDIREVLDDLGIYYSESGKNVSDGWIGVSCPFCGDESNHMGINVGSKTISCFICGTSGTIIKYLSEELGSFQKAIQILGDSVPRELRSFKTEEKERAIKVELPKEASSKITAYHAEYLEKRGYDYKELTEKYNLHFCGPYGEWRNRIIVPIIKRYKIVTFTSIDISETSNLRYRHLQDELSVIPIKHYLFGLEFTNDISCIVVEGLFDQFRMGDGSVCTFGTKITPEQIRLLSKFSLVKILSDGDEAGRVSAEKLANDLCVFTDVKLFGLSDGIDPDQLSAEDIKKIKSS